MRREMLSVDEAAERLGVSPYWLRKLLRAGDVRGWKVSGREKAHWLAPGKAGEGKRREMGLGPLRDVSLAQARAMAGKAVTVHGFRSTFRDWAGDRTSYPREIIETALAHAVGSATEAAYRRGDALERRRELMEAWAGYCEPEQAGNVVRLRG